MEFFQIASFVWIAAIAISMYAILVRKVTAFSLPHISLLLLLLLLTPSFISQSSSFVLHVNGE
jgi:hypothetical protein